MIRGITETLAGRIGTLVLLPFHITEMPKTLQKNQQLLGSYPELVSRKYKGHKEWYAAYYQNYLERDVRGLINIGNLRDFQRFMLLLAASTAQELNFSRFSKDIGVTVKTIQSWVSLLEASHIIHLLPPYYKNYRKRIVKRPKLYFIDTGLVSYLTGLRDQEMLEKGPLAGPIFENYVISEILKDIKSRDLDCKLYYFRNNLGLEVDLILEDASQKKITFCEIKATSTLKPEMLNNIQTIMQMETKSKTLFKSINGLFLYKGTKTITIAGIQCQNIWSFLS